MKITLPGGLKVNAEYHGFTHRTDQPEKQGGEGTAPSPFDLFLVSIGTCAGYYMAQFCNTRGIDTTGLSLDQSLEYNVKTKLIEKININVTLPDGFPEKYRSAILKAAASCTVKRHLENPPEIEVIHKGNQQ